MIHKPLEFTKEECLLENPFPAMYVLKCPHCETVKGSSNDPRYLPTEIFCWGNPTHDDWKEYKSERGLDNKDIADIIGMTTDSVKNQTQPSKKLPKWAISMLWEWVNSK